MTATTPRSLAAALALAAATLYLLYGVNREAALPLIAAAAVALPAWWYAHRKLPPSTALVLGVGLRVLAVFAFPLLSDDVYRFIWDGRLWWAGYHPLAFVPEAAPASFAAANADVLSAMNSPAYATVYPPGSQAAFALATGVAQTTYWAKVALASVLLVGEASVLYLLRRLGAASTAALSAYALHPLPTVEFIGNAHFEGLAVLGVLGAVYAYRRGRAGRAGVWLGTGVLVKLVPALAGPAIAAAVWRRRGEWRDPLVVASATVPVVALGLGAFVLTSDAAGFGDSLDLYFRTFEFNGGAYTVARAAGTWYRGWNWIAVVGPLLAAVSLCVIVALAGATALGRLRLPDALLFSFGAYLLFATTVHPWYAGYVLALAPLTRYRWPYLLGFAVMLSYLAYGQPDVEVPTWALLLEWGSVLGLAGWEVWRGGGRTEPSGGERRGAHAV